MVLLPNFLTSRNSSKPERKVSQNSLGDLSLLFEKDLQVPSTVTLGQFRNVTGRGSLNFLRMPNINEEIIQKKK